MLRRCERRCADDVSLRKAGWLLSTPILGQLGYCLTLDLEGPLGVLRARRQQRFGRVTLCGALTANSGPDDSWVAPAICLCWPTVANLQQLPDRFVEHLGFFQREMTQRQRRTAGTPDQK